MSNQTISQFPTQTPTDTTNLFLTGIDLTKPSGSQNRNINAGQMLAAIMAGNSGGSNGTYTHYVEGVNITPSNYADNVLYTPSVITNDVAMVSLQFGQASIIPQAFYFQIYAGVPSGSGVLIYDSHAATGTTIDTASAFCASTIYVPAAAGNNTLYIRIHNAGSSALTITYQGAFVEFAGHGIAMPTYTPPAPYTGALMSTVHVGPTEQFTQPIYGLQALADGGTMILDDGHYYFPICLMNTADSNITASTYTYGGQNYNVFGGTSAHPSNRFTGGITIKSASGNPYNCVWDGLGGVGNGYRLAEGKGLILCHVPTTIQGINFISAGGADGVGDGEAAIYSEVFLEAGTTTITGCAFDNCENGVLCPDMDTNNNGTWTANNGPGVNVSIALNTCDFGFNAGNGVTPDGLSHNFYNEGPSITVTNCHMYSAAVGNTQKCRGPLYVANNSYIEAGAGRAIDSPEGGSVTFNNCTLVTTPHCNDAFVDYNSESTSRPWRLSSFSNTTFNNCTVIGSRYPFSTLWNNTGPTSTAATSTNHEFVFNNVTQQWYLGPYGAGFLPQRVQSTYLTDDSAVTGLSLTPAGGTTETGSQTRPASIAQPSYTSTPIIAWNGQVTYFF